MAGGKASAAGAATAATIYTGGRITTNALAWAQSLAVAALQIAALKALLDKQKNHYDAIANKQIGFVETALNEYIIDLNNNLLPTFPDAYPDIPEAIPYTPVNTAAIVFDQMVENLQNQPKTEEYITRVNTLLRYNNMARMAFLMPGFMVHLQLASGQIGDLLNGKMSTGDVIEILTDTAEQAALTGRIGATSKTTHRNLGISRMRAQRAGRKELAEHAAFINRDVSPISQEVTIDSLMIKPEARMALALQETQLMQNALQNIANAAAQKPPYKLAQLQAKISAIIARLTYSANKGNMANQFVPNYAAVFGPSINSLTSGLGQLVFGDKRDTVEHPAGPEQAGTLTPTAL